MEDVPGLTGAVRSLLEEPRADLTAMRTLLLLRDEGVISEAEVRVAYPKSAC